MGDVEAVELHLAGCPDCSRELTRYRDVLAAAASLRGALEAPPPGFADRVMAHVTRPTQLWRSRAVDLVHDRRIHVAAASLGGALVGATAMAIVWSRLAKRAVAGVGTGLSA